MLNSCLVTWIKSCFYLKECVTIHFQHLLLHMTFFNYSVNVTEKMWHVLTLTVKKRGISAF